jgi:hypothetical protein
MRKLHCLVVFPLLLCLAVLSAGAQSNQTQGAQSAAPPAQSGASSTPAIPPTEISADLGGCSALITVTDAAGKPIFNAKVSTRIHYGFMAAKKIDLEAYTSANGQVKVNHLPEVPKKPIFFYVSKGDLLETVEFTPDVHCRASYDVKLK